MRLRDKKGRFISDGKPNKFNRKWVRRDKVVEMVDSDAIEEAYKAGFETARRVPKTHSAKDCYEGFLKHGQ